MCVFVCVSMSHLSSSLSFSYSVYYECLSLFLPPPPLSFSFSPPPPSSLSLFPAVQILESKYFFLDERSSNLVWVCNLGAPSTRDACLLLSGNFWRQYGKANWGWEECICFPIKVLCKLSKYVPYELGGMQLKVILTGKNQPHQSYTHTHALNSKHDYQQ